MTSQKIAIGLVAVALFIGSMTAHADDFDVGDEAYQRGDYATALPIFQHLADQGHAKAQFNLGVMYRNGQGVPQDNAAAARWYRKAADQGNARARTNLGFMYGKGHGVTQDYVQAYMWYILAAQGEKDTGELRDGLAKQMTPAQIAEAQKLAREWKPKGK